MESKYEVSGKCPDPKYAKAFGLFTAATGNTPGYNAEERMNALAKYPSCQSAVLEGKEMLPILKELMEGAQKRHDTELHNAEVIGGYPGCYVPEDINPFTI